MLQDYLRAYPPLTHANAYLQIQQMAQWLDVYLSKYPAQHINCMTSDSEFIAFINHAIQLVICLSQYLGCTLSPVGNTRCQCILRADNA